MMNDDWQIEHDAYSDDLPSHESDLSVYEAHNEPWHDQDAVFHDEHAQGDLHYDAPLRGELHRDGLYHHAVLRDGFLQHALGATGHAVHDCHVVGSPEQDAQLWEHQTAPFTCAVEAQRGIIEACTGVHFSEAELATEAAENGWLHSNASGVGAGSRTVDIGKLLKLHGIETHAVIDASVSDLVTELAAGHKVIVEVNSSDLWHPGSVQSFVSQGADHAIWVTGINADDPNHIRVTINDSGDPHGAGKEYSLDQFVDAWEDSGFYYLATSHAPPGLHGEIADFNETSGFFDTIVDWARDHALPLSLGAGAAVAAGLRVADLGRKGRLTEPSRSLREKLRKKNGRALSGDEDIVTE